MLPTCMSSNRTISSVMHIMLHVSKVLYVHSSPIIISYLNRNPSSRKGRIMRHTERQAIIKKKGEDKVALPNDIY